MDVLAYSQFDAIQVLWLRMSPLAFYWLAAVGLSHPYARLSLYPAAHRERQVSTCLEYDVTEKHVIMIGLCRAPTAAGLIAPEYLHTIYRRVALQTFLQAALCSRPPLLSTEAMAAGRLASGP